MARGSERPPRNNKGELSDTEQELRDALGLGEKDSSETLMGVKLREALEATPAPAEEPPVAVTRARAPRKDLGKETVKQVRAERANPRAKKGRNAKNSQKPGVFTEGKYTTTQTHTRLGAELPEKKYSRNEARSFRDARSKRERAVVELAGAFMNTEVRAERAKKVAEEKAAERARTIKSGADKLRETAAHRKKIEQVEEILPALRQSLRTTMDRKKRDALRAEIERMENHLERERDALVSPRAKARAEASHTPKADVPEVLPVSVPPRVMSEPATPTTPEQEPTPVVSVSPEQATPEQSPGEVSENPYVLPDTSETVPAPDPLKEELKGIVREHAIRKAIRNDMPPSEVRAALEALVEKHSAKDDLDTVWTSHIKDPQLEPAPVETKTPLPEAPLFTSGGVLERQTAGKSPRPFFLPWKQGYHKPAWTPSKPETAAAAAARVLTKESAKPEQPKKHSRKGLWFGLGGAGVLGAAALAFFGLRGAHETHQPERPNATPPAAGSAQVHRSSRGGENAPAAVARAAERSTPGAEVLHPVSVSVQHGEGFDSAMKRLQVSLTAAYANGERAPRLVRHLLDRNEHMLSVGFGFAKENLSAVLHEGDRLYISQDGKLVFAPSSGSSVDLLVPNARNANGFEPGRIYTGPMREYHWQGQPSYHVRQTTTRSWVERPARVVAPVAPATEAQPIEAEPVAPANVPPSRPTSSDSDFGTLSQYQGPR